MMGSKMVILEKQMHLSIVKLWMNSILNPRGFDFGTCDLDLVLENLDFGRGGVHLVGSKMVIHQN